MRSGAGWPEPSAPGLLGLLGRAGPPPLIASAPPPWPAQAPPPAPFVLKLSPPALAAKVGEVDREPLARQGQGTMRLRPLEEESSLWSEA